MHQLGTSASTVELDERRSRSNQHDAQRSEPRSRRVATRIVRGSARPWLINEPLRRRYEPRRRPTHLRRAASWAQDRVSGWTVLLSLHRLASWLAAPQNRSRLAWDCCSFGTRCSGNPSERQCRRRAVSTCADPRFRCRPCGPRGRCRAIPTEMFGLSPPHDTSNPIGSVVRMAVADWRRRCCLSGGHRFAFAAVEGTSARIRRAIGG